MNSTGQVQWYQTLGMYNIPWSIRVTADESALVISGVVGDASITIGSKSLTSSGNTDPFWAYLSPDDGSASVIGAWAGSYQASTGNVGRGTSGKVMYIGHETGAGGVWEGDASSNTATIVDSNSMCSVMKVDGGNVAWVTKLDGPYSACYARPEPAGAYVYAASDDKIYVIDDATGTIKNTYTIPKSDGIYGTVKIGTNLYALITMKPASAL